MHFDVLNLFMLEELIALILQTFSEQPFIRVRADVNYCLVSMVHGDLLPSVTYWVMNWLPNPVGIAPGSDRLHGHERQGRPDQLQSRMTNRGPLLR